MRLFRILAAAWAVSLVTAAPLPAETWTNLQGASIEGELRGLYGDTLLLARKNGTATFDVNTLDDASLRKVAVHLAIPAASPAAWGRASSKVAKGVAKKLQILQSGKLVPFDPGSRPEPEFYLVYFGAYWCGPCRRFSPRLLEAYQRLKAMAPDRFEVIFVSDDTSAGEQLKYANEVGMPWPMLKFNATSQVDAFEQWRAGGIPCLVVLTRDGDLLYHSYRGKEYLGADDPLEKFTALLESTRPGAAPAPQPGRHRLAVAQHIAAAAGGDRAAQPYLVTFDPRRHRTLKASRLTARLTLSAGGRVTDAEFTPQPDAVADEQLRRVAEGWLFLPSVTGGQPGGATIDLPLELNKS